MKLPSSSFVPVSSGHFRSAKMAMLEAGTLLGHLFFLLVASKEGIRET
jgi:hypothetical protein